MCAGSLDRGIVTRHDGPAKSEIALRSESQVEARMAVFDSSKAGTTLTGATLHSSTVSVQPA